MAEAAKFIKRHFIWLLLLTYLVAFLVPGPGASLAKLQWNLREGAAGGVRLPMILVAVLLLNAAMGLKLQEVQSVRKRTLELFVSLLSVWVGPALVVLLASQMFIMRGNAGSALLLGMILVAAMPVANSSAGWTQQSGGALGWALALVVFSILFSPIITPAVIRLLGMSLSAEQAAGVEEVVRKFSGVTFIVWVLAPTCTGMLIRRLAGGERIDALRPAMHVSSSLAILALNYLNGALVLPRVLGGVFGAEGSHPNFSLLIAAWSGALALCLSGLLVAELMARYFHNSPDVSLALRFALSMKHTGLALGLSTALLSEHPEAGLLILIATPTQHVLASLISRWYGGELE